MNFTTFQSHCKYAQYGLREGYSSEFELTCRRPDRIPEGCSWGACDKLHCPHFGSEFITGEMIDAETGKTLFTFGGGKIVFGE